MVRRSPIVLLFFSEASTSDVTAVLDEVAEQFQLSNSDPLQWCFPSGDGWRVLVRFDEMALGRYPEPDRKMVEEELGAMPSAVLHMTLNWAAVPQALGAAKTLITHLLQKFDGIADQGAGEHRIWNIEQIRRTRNGIGFLDCHR